MIEIFSSSEMISALFDMAYIEYIYMLQHLIREIK